LLFGWVLLTVVPTAATAGSTEAVDLVTRAEAGEPWAQLNLGAAYDHGLAGFTPDPVRAVAWYRRAAEAGLAEAQFNLAHCLATGNGTPRDDRAALRWMLRAARQGLPSAQFLAGVMYAEGIGTPVDRATARVWARKAAENGHLDAGALLQRLTEQDAAETAQQK
jgi:TPR repeat protein